MKRILSVAIALVLVIGVCAVFASAETYQLIPKDAAWSKVDSGGTSVNVEYKGDTVIFSGSASGTWPSVETYYADADIIKAPLSATLKYDFKVEGGATNITFYFKSSASGTPYAFPISNTALGDVTYDSGSGDINDGHYKGSITLKKLTEATRNYIAPGTDGKFNLDYALNDELWFAGIQVYSVNGAVITVNTLEVVTSGETTETPSEAESSEEVVESSDEPVDSSEAVTESSETPVDASSETPATSAESTADSSVAESDSSTATGDESSNSWIIWVVVACVVVIAAVVCGVVVSKKKKK